MMFLYLDSSALVKRYVDEPHSEEVAHLMDETLAIGTSAISRVEPRSSSQKTGRTLARYPLPTGSRRGTRLEARAAGIRCRTARCRPRMRGNDLSSGA